MNFIFGTFLLLKISCRQIPETNSPNPWVSIVVRVKNHWCKRSASTRYSHCDNK